MFSIFFPLVPTASLLVALLNKDIEPGMEIAFMLHCHFLLSIGQGDHLRSLPQSSLKSMASGILPWHLRALQLSGADIWETEIPYLQRASGQRWLGILLPGGSLSLLIWTQGQEQALESAPVYRFNTGMYLIMRKETTRENIFKVISFQLQRTNWYLLGSWNHSQCTSEMT